jgi:ubiquinone/menaquinone biosynthesis C-methylase UbiE
MAEMTVSAKLKENYDSYYQGESEWRALGAMAKADNIVQLCDKAPHDDILEIGSGEGAILKRLSDLNFGENLYSIEISQSAVATIRRRNIPRVRECRIFDGYHIPYSDRAFELAVLSHVLEHAEHPRMLLYEASRVAEYVFIEVPLEDTVRLKRDFVLDHTGHINFYSWKTIRSLVQSCGMQVMSQAVTNLSLSIYKYDSGKKGILKYGVKEFLHWASPGLARKLFTYHCSLICRKV